MRRIRSRSNKGGADGTGGGLLVSRETLRLLPILLPVTLGGFTAVGGAAWKLTVSPPSVGVGVGVAILLAAGIFAEAHPVPVENLPAGHVSLAAVFVLGAGIIYGWWAAVLVGLV